MHINIMLQNGEPAWCMPQVYEPVRVNDEDNVIFAVSAVNPDEKARKEVAFHAKKMIIAERTTMEVEVSLS